MHDSVSQVMLLAQQHTTKEALQIERGLVVFVVLIAELASVELQLPELFLSALQPRGDSDILAGTG